MQTKILPAYPNEPMSPAAPVPDPHPVRDSSRLYNELILRKVISPKLELRLAQQTPKKISAVWEEPARATIK